MQDEVIYQRLTEIMRDVFNDDAVTARPELEAGDVGAWDSFGNLRLMFAVEQAFDIELAASEISALRNAGDLVACISRAIQSKAG